MANRSRCCWPPEHFTTRRPAMSAMPARPNTSATGRVLLNKLAVRRSVSSTVRSLRSPPLCMTAEMRPWRTAVEGSMP
jgi:hypothetical protein